MRVYSIVPVWPKEFPVPEAEVTQAISRVATPTYACFVNDVHIVSATIMTMYVISHSFWHLLKEAVQIFKWTRNTPTKESALLLAWPRIEIYYVRKVPRIVHQFVLSVLPCSISLVRAIKQGAAMAESNPQPKPKPIPGPRPVPGVS